MFYFLISLLLTCFSLNAALPFRESLVNSIDNPSPALLEVFNEFDIHYEGSWDDVVLQTQKKWLRKEGTERWDTPSATFSKTQYELFSKLSMTPPSYAEESHYDYAVILGATLQRVRSRIMFLKKEWDRGIRFDKLVILTGDRTLNPDFENREALCNCPFPIKEGWTSPEVLPKNETQMCLFVLEQMDLPKWDNILVIDTPQKDGKRPNTKDTFIEWLTQSPIPGITLIVSDQPFLSRADLLAKHMLPGFEIETIGQECPWTLCEQEKRALPVFLDELARTIFTLKMSIGAS